MICNHCHLGCLFTENFLAFLVRLLSNTYIIYRHILRKFITIILRSSHPSLLFGIKQGRQHSDGTI